MTGKIIKIGVGVLVAAAAVSTLVVGGADAKQVGADRWDRIREMRIAERTRFYTKRENIRNVVEGGRSLAKDFNQSIIREAEAPGSVLSSFALAPPAPSPGTQIGRTSYDYQHNGASGYQVARTPGKPYAHFIWTHWPRIPLTPEENDRYVGYNTFPVSQGTTGYSVTPEYGRGGYTNMATDWSGFGHGAFHQSDEPGYVAGAPYQPWWVWFFDPGSTSSVIEALVGYPTPPTFGACPEVLWPVVEASRQLYTVTGTRPPPNILDTVPVVHEIAHSNVNDCPVDLLWYWRYDGNGWTTNPIIIDSTGDLTYVLADDPNSDKLAVCVSRPKSGLSNIFYYESLTDGVGWLNNTEAKIRIPVTNYTNPNGPQHWYHQTCCYDNSGVLHIAWDQQTVANEGRGCSIQHWNSTRGTLRTVAQAAWPTKALTGGNDLFLSKITMGIGDGGTVCGGGNNNNYVYITYSQMGGLTDAEQNDQSLEGFYNSEMYVSVSRNGGNTWAPGVNLTNTRTPKCNPGAANPETEQEPRPDSVCRSEHWGTLGVTVHDLDVMFISDKSAGGIPQGEGTWNMNPVHYLKIPGGTANAPTICPISAPVFGSILEVEEECEYHAPRNGSQVLDWEISNIGTATLTGDITVTDLTGDPTIVIAPAPGPGNDISIAEAGANDNRTVTLASNGAVEGLYTGQISITHNAAGSPRVYPIDFFVFDVFFCPQDEVLRTGVGSASLALNVETNGSYAGTSQGTMWRYSDSSQYLSLGSLLIAHGTQTDTTVFRRYGSSEVNPGNIGFRAHGNLEIDTSTYTTHAGYACGIGKMSTRDSLVGISMEWVFPQSASEDEIILTRYKLYRHKPTVAVSNLAIGVLCDFDAIPASWLGATQSSSVANYSGLDAVRNLVWTGGSDTLKTRPDGSALGTKRYRGGVVVPTGTEGAYVGLIEKDLPPTGPLDGFLYRKLVTQSGYELDADVDSAQDIYTLMAIDKGRSIAQNETLTFVLAYVADTVDSSSFINRVDQAIALSATFPTCATCTCPFKYDPNGDAVIVDVLDVVATVGRAFRGNPPTQDAGCPKERTALNAGPDTDVLDVVACVNVAFRGQSVASNFVDPCSEVQ